MGKMKALNVTVTKDQAERLKKEAMRLTVENNGKVVTVSEIVRNLINKHYNN